MKQSLVTAALMLLGVIAGVGAYFYHGRYNMAADEKHWTLTESVLETVRERSIQARARDIRDVPNLEDPKAHFDRRWQYAEMCAWRGFTTAWSGLRIAGAGLRRRYTSMQTRRAASAVERVRSSEWNRTTRLRSTPPCALATRTSDARHTFAAARCFSIGTRVR